MAPAPTKKATAAVSSSSSKCKSAISKTKAMAMSRYRSGKAGGGTIGSGSAGRVALFRSSSDKGKPRETLLSHLMEQHVMSQPVDVDDEEETGGISQDSNTDESSQSTTMVGLSFADILGRLGMNDRNTGWRNEWKSLLSEGLIVSGVGAGGSTFTSPFQLTATGIETASTPEYKDAVAAAKAAKKKLQAQTNEELHQHIKSKLMNKRGDQIFDLLLDHDEGLSRSDLAKSLGIASTGAYFSYALQQLKDLGYAENIRVDGGKPAVRLTDKSFVTKLGGRQAWYESNNKKTNKVESRDGTGATSSNTKSETPVKADKDGDVAPTDA